MRTKKAELFGRTIKRLLCLCLVLLLLTACAAQTAPESYGVFLSVTQDLSRLQNYRTVVIDAQYFTSQEIAAFRKSGHRVFTYFNIGSLESFRDYYDTFCDLTLGEYENWEEERWIDVSDPRWQSFVKETLTPSLLGKGVDGFFVDNCDVYYEFPRQAILDALSDLMRFLVQTGKPVLLNGGDTFLDAYCAGGGTCSDVITGINQETVFTRICWDTETFAEAESEERAYFTDYIERYAALGAQICLLEYTTDAALAAEIKTYCRERGFDFYISDSVELD